jgi:hypothetical protein
MNTERFNTLQKVVEARKAVGAARSKPGLTPAQQHILDTAYTQLVDVEDTLVLEELRDSVEQLDLAAKALGRTARRLRRSVERLRKVADSIGVAARALGALADVVSKAAGAGIL